MNPLRSLLFNIAFNLWTAVALILGWPVLLLPYPATYWFGRQWVRVSLWLLRHLVGLDHRVLGLEHARRGPAIYAVKHQSSWDTLVFALLLHHPAYVLKRELLFLPLFGLYLLSAGMIPVDRSGRATALKRMLAAARRRRDQGRDLLIFPEGTRVPPGAHQPYHPGIAALYSQLDLPVVPVALNSGLFWGRRSFNKKPGRITLEFLPAIPPGLPRRAFMAELETRLEGASRRLAEAPAAAGGGPP
jgi:1-acyl-sn-glycerol-3-phosphate acyltransferase